MQRAERARRTRRRIIDAAAALFLERGYAGATVRAIAEAAGVAVPTVELGFGTKARLLKAAIDVAIAGDDEPVPVLDRAWADTARNATSPAALLAVAAEVIAAAQSRSAGLVLAVFEGGRTDPGSRRPRDGSSPTSAQVRPAGWSTRWPPSRPRTPTRPTTSGC